MTDKILLTSLSEGVRCLAGIVVVSLVTGDASGLSAKPAPLLACPQKAEVAYPLVT